MTAPEATGSGRRPRQGPGAPSARVDAHRVPTWRAFSLLLLLPTIALPTLASCLACSAAGGPESDASAGTPAARSRVEAEAQRALDRADIAAARGDPDPAERSYREVLEVWPEDPRALSGLARVRLAQGAFEEAIELDDRERAAGELAPRSLAPRERCELWLSAAAARMDAGRGDADALLDRVEAEPLCPGGTVAPLRARSRAQAAQSAFEAGDPGSAIRAWQEAVALDPTRSDLELRLARALLDAGRRLDAVDALGRALAAHPADPALEHMMLEALGVPATPAADPVGD